MKKLSFFFAIAFLALLFSQNTTAQTLPDYLPAEGLVGWWPFNGNANDESGNGNDGVVNGATLTEDRDGNPNSAYNFDGVDDFIEIITLTQVAQDSDYTWSFWSNFPDNQFSGNSPFNATGAFITCYSWWLTLGHSGAPGLFYKDEAGAEGNNWYVQQYFNQYPSINDWHHFILIKQNTLITVFLDGQNVGSLTSYGFSNFNSGILWYGRKDSGQGSSFYEGLQDDFGFWNRALTPEEITALYTGVPYVAPCADPTACNFEQEGECVYPEPNLDCDGNCLNDCNNNGVCDENEVLGCKYPTACNYNAEATSDDDSCTFPDFGYDCAGNCLLDLNNNGLCDLEEVAGCTNIDAINYNAEATLDDGSCMVTCKGDFDNDGQITINDLLGFLASFGNQCDGAGCMEPDGCNYDPNATFDLGYCEYPVEFFNCDGSPINDADGDGIPDELEVAGCTDPEAVNYTPEATDDDGSCVFGIVGDAHTCGAENVHNPDLVYGSVTDIDGNTYRTIVIGEQEWMAENLNVSHYANGEPIPNVTDSPQWVGLSTGAWCYYDNNPAYECPYGKLYNWYVTIDERNVCPTGWHVPSDAEWTILTNYLGGESVAGGKMKSFGTTYWGSPNNWATNETGFSGLPSGSRLFGFENLSVFFSLWSSTESNASNAWHRRVNSDSGDIASGNPNKESGLAIRCLRD